jgi:hypothetical protein
MSNKTKKPKNGGQCPEWAVKSTDDDDNEIGRIRWEGHVARI